MITEWIIQRKSLLSCHPWRGVDCCTIFCKSRKYLDHYSFNIKGFMIMMMHTHMLQWHHITSTRTKTITSLTFKSTYKHPQSFSQTSESERFLTLMMTFLTVFWLFRERPSLSPRHMETVRDKCIACTLHFTQLWLSVATERWLGSYSGFISD